MYKFPHGWYTVNVTVNPLTRHLFCVSRGWKYSEYMVVLSVYKCSTKVSTNTNSLPTTLSSYPSILPLILIVPWTGLVLSVRTKRSSLLIGSGSPSLLNLTTSHPVHEKSVFRHTCFGTSTLLEPRKCLDFYPGSTHLISPTLLRIKIDSDISLLRSGTSGVHNSEEHVDSQILKINPYQPRS